MFSTSSTTANVNGKRAASAASIESRAHRLENTPVDPQLQEALELASEIAAQYRISSLEALLTSCRSAVAQEEIAVAILGRFKAGKSSFVNDFTGRSILPVGVVPVTTVITEIRFGPVARAEVHFLDDHVESVPIDDIGLYVSERENPENRKLVDFISVELPELERFRGLRFVDTPGLESVLAHNTDTSVRWLPNVGIALVAVSVDPPLSQQDIELLKALYKYTPNISILLTKIDLLGPDQRAEVLEFIYAQLAKAFNEPPPVWPYSVHAGYENLKLELEENLLQRTLARFGESRRAILARKIGTLLAECSDYVRLSLRSAELVDSEREELKEQAIGEKQVISDVKSELRLIANHAAGGTRSAVAARLDTHQNEIENRLLADFSEKFPTWTRSLAHLLNSFSDWLARALAAELAGISLVECPNLGGRLHDAGRQFQRYLQDFRDRLSEKTKRAFGVPLRTTEVEFDIRKPETPDIRIGNIFDRNWELLSPVLPMWLIKGMVRSHFARKIPYMVFKNLSRLASQWEEAINTALLNMEREAERRLDELMATVERLIETGRSDHVSTMRLHLDRIESVQVMISASESPGPI